MLKTTSTRLSAGLCNRFASAAATQTAQATQTGTTGVFKFGGTSVGSADALRNVGTILSDSRDAGNRPVGVLSAMYSVTNRLIRAKDAAAVGDLAALRSEREGIWGVHERTINQLLSGAHRVETLEKVDALLREHLDATTAEVMEAGEASIYHADVIASLGERMSVTCLAAHLQEQGYLSAAVQADDVIITDGVSGNSMPLLDHTADRVSRIVRPVLDAGGIPVVTGFFGAGLDGKLTTLGRGGSDLTAATLGYCLDADEVSLFKVEHTEDDNGFMSGWEPGFVGVVHDADTSQTVDSLNYSDARELAHFGKSVLHPATVAPAVEKNIPVFVKNTYEPSAKGTVIKDMPAPSTTSIVNALTKISVAKYATTHGVDNLPLVGGDLEDNTLIALVGDDLCRHGDDLARACETVLEAHGIASAVPERVNGSADSFAVVVPAEAAKQAVRLLHDEFVSRPVTDVLENMSVLEAQKEMSKFTAKMGRRPA
eukprot:CAMPEP_0182458278 /NCGR_PEP_ID=MMETSP1319-20130603/3656_1 /TAXON_ID=172717 /ORGANISM="Bolidomonas pacifica, Strain RCC208" /LENGTH=484 /DNA_ID=CAMNT_0024656935 /DNA_START=17 /DNA_END=1468 /DNA_ORIENTATION=-